MFEEMGFKIDHASPIYKRFRLKVLGTVLILIIFTIFVLVFTKQERSENYKIY